MGKHVKIAVIGAGASGMMAAIAAAGRGAEVTLFEKNDRIGKKILATGNGKCNLSNLNCVAESYYCSDKEKLQRMLDVFSPWDTISFFESMGLMIKDKDGSLYPYSEQASAVLDVLRMELAEKKVTVIPESEINFAEFRKEKSAFGLRDKNGKTVFFQKLIIAGGSPASMPKGGKSAYHLAKLFGHHVKELVPGLVQLKSDEGFCKALAGVRCGAKINLIADGNVAASEEGEVQFTDYGVSGIPVFQFSRQAAYAMAKKENVSVVLDFFPEQDVDAFRFFCKLRYEAHKNRTLEEFLTGTLNKKINMVLIKRNGYKPGMKAADIGCDKILQLMDQCKSFSLHISGVNPIEHAQVCAGGVDFGEINDRRESRLFPGLYFAGEMVDVDGCCGGYNLQWAWTSGYIAGVNASNA